jgi:hypothetical protein
MPSKAALSALRTIRDQVNAQKPKIAQPIVQAPEIIIPSKISSLKENVRRSKGEFGARRVERAADEVKNLEKLFGEQALRDAFGGDNARALMTMDPRDFEKYSEPLHPRFMDEMATRYSTSGERMSFPDYMTQYLPNVGPFSSVPFLEINKKTQGSSNAPFISGHEGRHRSRVMADKGEETGLVQLLPRAQLRESFPRGSQEEYLEALKQEMELTGNMVMPETYFDDLVQKDVKRKAVKLPEPYAGGGAIKGALAAAKKAVGKARGDEPKPDVPEQKMLQGFYRGFAGDGGAAPDVFVTPQKRVADYYAQKRAGQTGQEPHAEMVLADPFAGRAYGHSTPGTGKQEPLFTRARKMKESDVVDRTPLYAQGGSVATFKDGGAAFGVFPQMQPRRAANSGAGERMTEEALKFFIPQDTTDLALMAFPFGKAGKAAAAGLLALTPAESEAGKVKTGVDLARRSFFGLRPSQDMKGRELVPVQKDLDRMQAELAKAPKVEQKTTTVQPSPTAPKIEQTVKSIAETPVSRRTVLKSAAGQAIQGALPASSFADLMKPATVAKQAVQAMAPAAAVTASSVPALMAKAVKMGMDSDEALAFVKRELGESAETVMAKQDPELLYDTLKDPFESIVDDPEWLYKFKNGKQDRLMGPGELLQVQLGQGETPGPLKETLRALKAEMSPEDYANMKNAMKDAINQEIKYGGDY